MDDRDTPPYRGRLLHYIRTECPPRETLKQACSRQGPLLKMRRTVLSPDRCAPTRG
jgi:hypothetical protein